ncbi:MAG: acetate kinase, partial [Microcystaceae cyanobacterium]
MKILVLNAGSSSQKSCLYNLQGDSLPEQAPHPLWEGMIDWTAKQDGGILTVKANGFKFQQELNSTDRLAAIQQLLQSLIEGETQVLESLTEIDLVGHRVVHGGSYYSQATLITPEVEKAIAALIPLAPNHNPAHLEGIKAIAQILGNVAQIAIFDTAFHQTIPPAAAIYPIPKEYTEQGIRRYGFHGISHQYCAKRCAQILGKPLDYLKIITCHIGNGASLAAIKNGQSVDTTMGFTPLEGLMMGTRSGSIDPAILIYLMREKGLTADQLNELLNKQSGLKGVSGISADLRPILQAMTEGNESAQLAFDMYIHRFRACVGQMLASLGGLDAI